MKGAPCKKRFSSHHTRFETGMALFGVLAGAAVLSALGLLLLASIQRNSHSSMAGTRALSSTLALELTTALLEQELLAELRAGSKPVATGTAGGMVYYPATALSAAPFRPPGLPPNLLRQSRRDTPFYDDTLTCAGASVYPDAGVYRPSRQALGVSTEARALNVAGISLARWNAPALLPRTTDSLIISTAKGAVLSGTARVGGRETGWIWTAPDWIVLRRDGSVVGDWSAALRSTHPPVPSPESASLRYAFQIYDGGGLLDLNHAGYDPTDISPEEAARKGSTAFADLTHIGLPMEATRALVRWRSVAKNEAPSGLPFGNRLLNLLLGPARGPYWNGSCDKANHPCFEHRFTTRTQLIQFLESLAPNAKAGRPADALQYVTHFSRALEQPSHRHGAWEKSGTFRALPRVVGPAGGVADSLHSLSAAPLLPAKDLRVQMNLPYEMALGNYRGGNDAWGTFVERGAPAEGSGTIQDAINPPLLEVRVTTPFTRRDGTRAEIGDPLLKSRFPLARLAWLTHRGPSAQLASNDPLYNAEGTPAAIKECFGLEWTRDAGLAYQVTDAPGPPQEQLGYFFWKYDHRSADGKLRSESIARLSSVADAGREPDFFELLKAGILVGSLGKPVGGRVWSIHDVHEHP